MAVPTDQRPNDRSRESGDEISPAAPHSDKAQRYRLMAEEVRSAADEMHDIVSRQTLRRIADDYDRLAVRSERRLRDAYNSAASRVHR